MKGFSILMAFTAAVPILAFYGHPIWACVIGVPLLLVYWCFMMGGLIWLFSAIGRAVNRVVPEPGGFARTAPLEKRSKWAASLGHYA